MYLLFKNKNTSHTKNLAVACSDLPSSGTPINNGSDLTTCFNYNFTVATYIKEIKDVVL